jgi:hypothetical protein
MPTPRDNELEFRGGCALAVCGFFLGGWAGLNIVLLVSGEPRSFSGAVWLLLFGGMVAGAVLGALVFPLVGREVWAWLKRRRRR